MINNEPSRKDFREARFYEAAERGCFEAKAHLFGKEARSLIKKGFYVERIGTDTKSSLPSVVSWEFAFPKGIPPVACQYISGSLQTFPKNLTWAQELFVIAAHVLYSRGKAQTYYTE